MNRDRSVSASYAYTNYDALNARWDERQRLRDLVAIQTLEALAAKKGRVIVAPSLLWREQHIPTRAATMVVATAQTAPRPGWRRAHTAREDDVSQDAETKTLMALCRALISAVEGRRDEAQAQIALARMHADGRTPGARP